MANLLIFKNSDFADLAGSEIEANCFAVDHIPDLALDGARRIKGIVFPAVEGKIHVSHFLQELRKCE